MKTTCKIKRKHVGKGYLSWNSNGSKSARVMTVLSEKDMGRLRRQALRDPKSNISDMIRQYVLRGLRKDEDAETIPDDFLDT